MIVYLLRHGTPVGGRTYRGNLIDDPLTEEGWDQMKSSVKNISFEYIATSPMKRCSEFADYISRKIKIPYSIIEDFKEIGFGDWQGKTSSQIGEDIVAKFKKNPIDNPILNAENLYDFQDRVMKKFLWLIKEQREKKKILVIAHAGVIRVIKAHYKKIRIEEIFLINIDSGSIDLIEV